MLDEALNDESSICIQAKVRTSTVYYSILRIIDRSSMDYIGTIIKGSTSDVQPEEAILILSNRLQHSQLSLDRRSAVLGLRSFSRQYREIVVEYGSKTLLKTLALEKDDIITLRAVLETILILFMKGAETGEDTRGWINSRSRSQSGKYPSPRLLGTIEVDQFSLWLADESTSSAEYLSCLIELVQNNEDFQMRSYAIQLLEALLIARPSKTKDLFTEIPSAISMVVSVLNDASDQIRSEAILLLMTLVKDNYNIQKVVAFENTFEIIFQVLQEEGGLRGSIIVQDCLTLVHNLLAYNDSNQKYFLQSGCVPKLAEILADLIAPDTEGKESPGDMIWNEQRVNNMTTALEICRAFAERDNEDSLIKQNSFFDSGIFFDVLKLVFASHIDKILRSLALEVAGDLMAGNKRIQLEFSKLDVPYVDPSLPLPTSSKDCLAAPAALLNWALLLNSVHCFNVRLSASYCFQCFVEGNEEAKVGFMEDQIEDFKQRFSIESNSDIVAEHHTKHKNYTNKTNLLSVLLHYDDEIKLNPYKAWFASFFMICLVNDCKEARQLAQDVKVGNENNGEDVMSLIQAIAQILVTTMELADPRVPVAYISILTFWLFEDFDAVDDLLNDIDTVKAIMSCLMRNASESTDLADGTCFILLGVIYEFSRNSSPYPRAALHAMIVKSLGAENYALKVKKVFQVHWSTPSHDLFSESVQMDNTGLPNVFFIPLYQNLMKENYYRIKLALRHDPQQDPPLRITFEAYEALQFQYEALKASSVEKESALAAQLVASEEKNRKLTQSLNETEEKLTTSEGNVLHISRLNADLKKSVNDSRSELEDTQSRYEDLRVRQKTTERDWKEAQGNTSSLMKEKKALEAQLKATISSKEAAESGINKMNKELRSLTASLQDIKKELNDTKEVQSRDLMEANSTISFLKDEVNKLREYKQKTNGKIFVESEKWNERQTMICNLEGNLRKITNEKTERETEIKKLMDKLKSAALVVQSLRQHNASKDVEIHQLRAKLKERNDRLASVTGARLEPTDNEQIIRVERASRYEPQMSNDSINEISALQRSLKILQKENEQLKMNIGQHDVEGRWNYTGSPGCDNGGCSKEEFDELLLSWEDQVSKLARCKSLLRKHDISVSSDEEN